MERKLLYTNAEILQKDCDLGIDGHIQLPINDLCIALTNRCNLHCIMCPFCLPEYENKTYNNETPFVTTFDEYKQILSTESAKILACKGNNNQAVKSPLNIHFTHGESLLNPQIAEIAKYTKEVMPDSVIRLSSNGTVNPDLIKDAYSLVHNIDHFCFSIDGCTKEVFEAIRKPAKFENVMSNLEAWSEVAKQVKKDKIFRFTVALSAINIKELTGLVELAVKLGGYYAVAVQPLIVDDKHKELESFKLEYIDKELARNEINRAKETAQRLGIPLILNPAIKKIFETDIENHETEIDLSEMTPYCNYFSNGLIEVDNSGSLKELCCNMSPEDNKYLMEKYNIKPGNTVFESYNSKELWTLRSDMLKGRLRKYCKNCIHAIAPYNKLGQDVVISRYESPETKDEHITQLRAMIRDLNINLNSKNGIINDLQENQCCLNMQLNNIKAEIDSLKTELSGKDEELENKKAKIKSCNAEIDSLKIELNDRIEELGNKNKEIKNFKEELNSLKIAFDKLSNENNQNIKRYNDICSSRSWKITKPLRAIKRIFNKLMNRMCRN